MRTVDVLRRGGRPPRCLLATTLSFAVAISLAGQSAVPAPTPASETAPASLLEPGKLVRRSLAGGQSHSYRIALEAGQFADIVVDQQGIDVVATLSAPDGKKLVEMDSPNASLGPEPIVWIAEASGDYRLEVASPDPSMPRAGYSIAVLAVREPTARDRARVRAQTVLTEADAQRTQGKAESLSSAVDSYKRSAEMAREADDPALEARALFFLGNVFEQLGEQEKALARWQETAALQGRLGDSSFEGVVLTSLGIVSNNLAEPVQALAYLKRAAERQEGDRYALAATLNSIGESHYRLGNLQDSMENCRRSLEINRQIGNHMAEAVALANLALVYDDLGEKERAIEELTRALEINRRIGRKRGQAAVLNNLGRAWASIGEWTKALACQQEALVLRKEVGDRFGEGITLGNIGWVHANRGEAGEALDFYDRSLAIRRQTGDRLGEATTLQRIGLVRASRGEFDQALQKYSEALAVARNIQDRQDESDTLLAMARVFFETRSFPEAQEAAESALTLVESMRGQLSSQRLRATFLGALQDHYEVAIAAAMKRHEGEPSAGFDRAAFRLAERSRARGLLELLAEARAQIREGIDPRLLEREQTIRHRLAAKFERQTRLLEGSRGGPEVEALAKEIQELERDHETVEEEIRTKSPRYAALTQPRPIGVEEVQREILDDRSVLLEYSLGRTRSFLWVVSGEGLATVVLPGRERIEAAARAVHEAWERSSAGAAPGSSSHFGREAAALSSLILDPAAKWIAGKRLVIVADGVLHYVPFGALPDPSGGGASVVSLHEIVSLPSASTLSALRIERPGRRGPRKTLAVLADPVFERRDPRVRVAARAVGAAGVTELPEPLARSTRDAGGGFRLERLPFTRREADAILPLVPAGQRKAALGFAASRQTALDQSLSRYRFVHFATHGLLNSVHPELSGLVLSLVDRNGRDQEGFLPASEVFNLKLSADLVVLSACRTALGKEVRGEGLVGLTRAFMYAGAPRVVASLWRVDDAATAELMKTFYQGMLGPSKLSASAALRQAQLTVSRQNRWSHPYYWAGFVLQGEWR